MTLRLLSSQRYPLPGTEERFLHLGTIIGGFREFLVLADTLTMKGHIQEITGGTLREIEKGEEELWQELNAFAQEKKLFTAWEKTK